MAVFPTDSTERLLAFQREVNRVFRRFFEEARKDRGKQVLTAGDAFDIPVDVYDRGDQLVVEVEAAGVPKEALRLTVSRDLIVRHAEAFGEDDALVVMTTFRRLSVAFGVRQLHQLVVCLRRFRVGAAVRATAFRRPRC